VATVLVQLAQQEARARATTLITEDVAPTSPNDPNGSVEFYCIAFLGIGGAVGGTVLARILGPVRSGNDVLRRVGLVLLYAAVLSAVVAFFADVILARRCRRCAASSISATGGSARQCCARCSGPGPGSSYWSRYRLAARAGGEYLSEETADSGERAAVG
jgi:hypothetical protein